MVPLQNLDNLVRKNVEPISGRAICAALNRDNFAPFLELPQVFSDVSYRTAGEAREPGLRGPRLQISVRMAREHCNYHARRWPCRACSLQRLVYVFPYHFLPRNVLAEGGATG